MPIYDRHRTRRRVTRLTILVGAVALLAGGLYALFQFNSERQQLTPEQVITQANEAAASEQYKQVVDLLEDTDSPLWTRAMIHDKPDMLVLYAEARQNVALPRGRHLRRAVAPLRKALALDPENEQARQNLLKLLVRLDRADEVIQLANDLGDRFPQDAELKRYVGSAHLRLANDKKALEAFEQAAELEPLHVRTQAAVIELLIDQGKDPQPFYNRAKALHQQHPGDPRAELIYALACRATNDLRTTRKLLTAAADRPATDDEFIRALVREMDRAGLYVLSANYLDRLGTNKPQSYAAQESIRRAFDNGNYPRVADRLAKRDPRQTPTDLLAMRAIAVQQAGDHKLADRLIDELDRRDNIVAQSWVRLLPIIFNKTAKPYDLINEFNDLLADQQDEGDAEKLRQQPYLMQVLGETYLQVNQPQRAIGPLRAAASHRPSWSRPHRLLARVMLSMNKPDDALRHAEMAMIRQPNKTTMVLHASTLLAATNPRDAAAVTRAVNQADALIKRAPDEPRLIGGAVGLLARAGRVDEARQRVEEALKPDAPEKTTTSKEVRAAVLDPYTRVLVHLDQHAQAWSLLEPRLDQSPMARGVALARVRQDLKDPASAKRWLKRITAIQTADKGELLERSRAAFWAGMRLSSAELRAKSHTLINQLLATPGPHTLDAYYLHGQIAYEHGDFADSEASFRRVLKQRPNEPAVLNYLALVLAARGKDLGEAERFAEQAVGFATGDPNLLDTLATVRLKRGEYDRAMQAIKQAIVLEPSNPAWRMTQAKILEAQGNQDEADAIRRVYSRQASN